MSGKKIFDIITLLCIFLGVICMVTPFFQETGTGIILGTIPLGIIGIVIATIRKNRLFILLSCLVATSFFWQWFLFSIIEFIQISI